MIIYEACYVGAKVTIVIDATTTVQLVDDKVRTEICEWIAESNVNPVDVQKVIVDEKEMVAKCVLYKRHNNGILAKTNPDGTHEPLTYEITTKIKRLPPHANLFPKE